MNHDEVQESLGAYALDALEPDEADVVTRHLLECPRCRAEVTMHRETVALLGNFGAQAPDGVWDRIAADLSGNDEVPVPMRPLGLDLDERPPALVQPTPTPTPTSTSTSTPAPTPAPAPAPAPSRRSRRSRRTPGMPGMPGMTGTSGGRRPSPFAVRTGALVAAAAVVVAFAAVSYVRLDHHVRQLRAAVAAGGAERAATAVMFDSDHRDVHLRSNDGEVTTEVVVAPDGEAYVIATELPALNAGRTYQLWGLVEGRVVSLGLLGRSPRLASFRVDPAVTQLMVTAEPAGGVVVPDSQVLIQGQVPSA